MRNLLLGAVLVAAGCWAQNLSPVLLGAGNLSPFPLTVAPGQLLTLFVQPGGAISQGTSMDVSAVFSSGTDQAMPVLQVVQANTGCNAGAGNPCPQVLAVTVQVPFGIAVICPLCESPILAVAATITVSMNGVKTPPVSVQPLQDQVHLLTVCDASIAGAGASPALNGGLPCTPMITHADGRMVSNILPAKAGEELVAYATGLGQTNPALTLGQPASESSPTVTTFGIDFNYRVNALATEPGAVGAPSNFPLFSGATKGYVGLYQVNFIVPPPPAGLQPCVNNAAPIALLNYVRSNLTVSVGSDFSFDGAGICVTPGP